jgi:hypothetical protein
MQYVMSRVLQTFEKMENKEPIPNELKTEVVISPAFPVLVSFSPVSN